MLTLFSSIFGIVSGLLPAILRMWERRYEQQHEKEMLQIRLEGIAKGVEISAQMEDSRNLVREGIDLRAHDSSIAYNGSIETLRASVRPVITYSFFGLFCFIKILVALKLSATGVPIEQLFKAIWSEEETVLLAAILSFWFGSRITTKLEEINIKKQTLEYQKGNKG